MVIAIRPATADDIPELRVLIETSVRGLHQHDYTTVQIERALVTVFGVDTQLIDDGTYFVAQAVNGANLAAGGGWSKRRTLSGSDHATNRDDTLLDPARDAAKIRAFFVDPALARRGIGSRLLIRCEAAAAAAGFTRFELAATLTGVGLYAAHGYRATEHTAIALGEGERLPVVRMEKSASR